MERLAPDHMILEENNWSSFLPFLIYLYYIR